MVNPEPIKEKPPVLLREDSQYTLKQITSIIKDKDYKDLGNHATKAMGETGLFSLTQVCIRPYTFHNSSIIVLYPLPFFFLCYWRRGS